MITREMLRNRPKYITELTPDNMYLGMKVRIKSVEQLKCDCPDADMFNDVVVASKYNSNISFTADMLPLCGRGFTVNLINNEYIYLDLEPGWACTFFPDWLEPAD